jgi:hypothetical protein
MQNQSDSSDTTIIYFNEESEGNQRFVIFSISVIKNFSFLTSSTDL